MLSVNTIHQIIDEYNRYHAPEVIAQLSSYDKHFYCIRFTGSFCNTCGIYDYFDDFKYLLEDRGISTKIAQITEIETGAYVSFQHKCDDGKPEIINVHRQKVNAIRGSRKCLQLYMLSQQSAW